MKTKIALNIRGLDDRQKLQKFKKGIDGCTDNTDIGETNPTLKDCQGAYDAADAKLKEIDEAEEKLKALRIERDQLMDVAMEKYGLLASFVENKSLGNPAIITKVGFDLVGASAGAPNVVSRVMNLVLTAGDHDGSVDASWNRDKAAKSYEVQTATDAKGPWTQVLTSIKSSCTIGGQASGTRIWARVRSISSTATGEWSDPATIIVP